MSANAASVFKDSDVAKTLSTIHDKYVVVPADKTQNNIVVSKTYNIHDYDQRQTLEIIPVIRPTLPPHSSKKR